MKYIISEKQRSALIEGKLGASGNIRIKILPANEIQINKWLKDNKNSVEVLKIKFKKLKNIVPGDNAAIIYFNAWEGYINKEDGLMTDVPEENLNRRPEDFA